MPGEVDVQVSALSAPARAVAVVVACVVALTVLVHLAMVFLHVAPANTVSKQHSQAVYDYVYPEYEQNWKLFAPNPVQQNIDVEVRARVRPRSGGGDGGTTVTAWTDLTAQDGAAIHHNPFPSHASQNELRRAWEVFLGSHNDQNQPTGQRGVMSERFLRRLAMLRMSDQWVRQGRVEQVQFRSKTIAVPPPPWSSERIDLKPVYREVPWWNIRADDLPEGATDK
ncbi:DUF5819 family protein [Streptomyces sp. NPDC059740]|uniref:DUF5819 family protein n=1 Tax=Streptomyces sp. NPDC059740 TaxID=3346926 RepID=UPI00364D5754